MQSNMAKTVLITGTSSGYGKATVDLFVAKGWNVVATMRDVSKNSFVQSSKLIVVRLDVTDEGSITDAITRTISVFGTLDAMINNAGIGLASAVEATPRKTIEEVFNTNTFGVINACRIVIPYMRRQGSGVIVNVTSNAAIAPMPLVAVYVASKAAIEGFTESLSYELAPFNIDARLVEPGLAPTTAFGHNCQESMSDVFPSAYQTFANAYFARMAAYPTAYCTEDEAAQAAYAAATSQSRTVRFCAGADSTLLTQLRWSTSEEEYLAKMRQLFEPSLAGAPEEV